MQNIIQLYYTPCYLSCKIPALLWKVQAKWQLISCLFRWISTALVVILDCPDVNKERTQAFGCCSGEKHASARHSHYLYKVLKYLLALHILTRYAFVLWYDDVMSIWGEGGINCWAQLKYWYVQYTYRGLWFNMCSTTYLLCTIIFCHIFYCILLHF